MRFACLHIPDFSLQAAWRGEPASAGRAAVVVDGKPPYLRVIAFNEMARRKGVSMGMPAADVQALDTVGVRRRSEAQELSAHAALLDCARAFSPRVEDTAIDTVLLDFAGMERLLGSPSRISRQILHQAEILDFRIQVAVAAISDTAIIAARGFSGITLIPSGQDAEKLAELPVEILNPSPEGREILYAWGIHRLKDLAALPPAQLSERLGQEGVRWWQLAQGGHLRPLMMAQEAQCWEEAWELDDPAETLDSLEFVLSSVLTRLAKRLEIRSLAAEELRLRLDLGQGIEPEPSLAWEEMRRQYEPSNMRIYERTLRLPLPICNPSLFFKLWQLHLDSDPPPAPVIRIAVTAKPARPRPAQGGLFSPLAPDPERLELTLARIKSIVGNNNVGSPALIDSHRPHAFRMDEFSYFLNPPALHGPAGRDRAAREGKTVTNSISVGLKPRPSVVASEVGEKVGVAAAADIQGLKPWFKLPPHSARLKPYPAPKVTVTTPSPAPLLAGHPLPQGGEGHFYSLRVSQSEITTDTSLSQSPGALTVLRIFRPPLPAQVKLCSGRPAYLFSSKMRGKIFFAAGPWRNSGDWWNDESWDFEEWDVEIVSAHDRVPLHHTTETGEKHGSRNRANPVYRLCHDLTRDEWYVQGEYD